MMNRKYDRDILSARDAQELAHIVAFGPVVFQVARIMLDEGIFEYLREHRDGCTVDEIASEKGLTEYAVKVLMESSLTMRTVYFSDGRYHLAKTGWFMLADPMVKVNMDFNHTINYKGMYHLDEALHKGRPAGLPELGPWETIYEGLSMLGESQKEGWFGFDHFYSDNSFDSALPYVLSGRPRRLLDIGGNTGKWAMKCVGYDSCVEVTVADLPEQIAMMKANIEGVYGSDRISGYGVNLLEREARLPGGFDVVWMSQFLDCFSDAQVVDILSRAKDSLNPGGKIFILETLWDRQKYSAASFDVAQTSVYFTAMANGNSKMFNTSDLWSYIERGGLEPVNVIDGLGYAHSLIECMKKDA